MINYVSVSEKIQHVNVNYLHVHAQHYCGLNFKIFNLGPPLIRLGHNGPSALNLP
jgi:hypothetical protein